MRIAVISDTHLPRGARVLPDGCLERCRSADLLLHGGDVVTLAFWEELSALGPRLEGVYGNMDESALQGLLPRERVIDVGGARIGMVHDAGPRPGREDRLVARFPGCKAVVYGHTHVPQVTRHDSVWILNPGSPTERRKAPVHSMLVLDLRDGAIEPRLVEL